MHARLLLGDVGGAYQAGRIWSVTGGMSTSNPKNPGMCSRGQIMRFSLVTTFAAALLLAACSTPSEEAATTSGSGSSSTGTTQSTTGTQSGAIPEIGRASCRERGCQYV